MKKLHSGHMELAVANLIGYRANVIVPNVSWGLGLRHECDLLVLDALGRFTEVEIKISKADLKADFKKGHGHKSKIISRLIYAVPDELIDTCMELIPDRCGIIAVSSTPYGFKARWVKQCRHKVVELPSPGTIKDFYRLGCMRIWSLKQHNNNKRHG